MPLSRQQFIVRLNASGVMTADEVCSVETSLAGDGPPTDAQGLAKLLVSAGKLTKYQAAAIYQGKTKGLVLGNYVILDKIGAGGMGQVFKALHRRMKRVVALKVLPAEATKDADAVQRFHREVEAAARLEHPNIVTAHDADEADGMHFLVMEFVAGKDLSAIVKENGPLPVAQAVECIRQAACGLAYAHAQGVIHRDIKPANLLLTVADSLHESESRSRSERPTIKILDMGLARLESQIAEQTQAAGLTQSGQIMGTVDYMSPEQAEETRGVDGRADQYSLGCTLWVLLTGRPMFEATTTIAKLMAHRNTPAPSLRAARADVPEALEAIYERMVAKEPDERYPSMEEVVAALETCLGQPAPAKLDGPSSSDSALTDFLRQVAGEKSVTTRPPVQTEINAETMQRLPVKEETGTQHEIQKGEAPAEPVVDPRVARVKLSAKSAAPPWLLIGGGLASLLLLIVAAGGLMWLFNGNSGDASLPDPAENETPTAMDARPMPPPAIAPFDATQAQQHQQAWAEYLGLPVEKEITLPGGEKLTMVLIPPGEFLMGSTDVEQAKFLEEAKAANDTWANDLIPSEGPQHRVRITTPFYLGKYEVTQGQWQAVMGSDPSQKKHDSVAPVDRVSWDDIQPFLARLNAGASTQEMKFALPTEAQWEYACRAGTTTAWHCDDSEETLRKYGWFNANSGRKMQPVGQLQHNSFGLYDMHGNAWEWCADWFDPDYYATSPVDNPTGPSAASGRVVIRGGYASYFAGHCRSARRNSFAAALASDYFGFRLAASIDAAVQANYPAPAGSSTDAPPPAVAPFGEGEAKRHQQAWAEYLGLPVEKEVTLPGGAKLTLVLIPPGEFLMGSTSEERARSLEEAKAANDLLSLRYIPTESPQHRVRITQPFYLGGYEVTQIQWQSVMGTNPSDFKDNPLHPVEQVSWDDIQPFLAKLNESSSAENLTFALPTEAQWEYACRAGTTRPYHGGEGEDDLREYGWFNANSDGKTNPAGDLKANAFGLYDMHGNVWEWCADWYAGDHYTKTRMVDPTGPSAGTIRVFRGGSWRNPPWCCRSAYRDRSAPDVRYSILGFRLAASIDSAKVLADQPASGGGDFALAFDGVDDYVSVPSLTYEGGPFTVEARIRCERLRVATIVGGGGAAKMNLHAVHDGLGFHAGVAGVLGRRDVRDLEPTDRWRHVAGVWDGRALQLFVDGEPDRGAELFGGEEAGPSAFYIGAEPNDATAAMESFFEGEISEVRISKIARYTEPFGPPERLAADDDTVAAYHVDEGAGDVLRDSSGKNHHGKIVGATWVRVEPPQDGTVDLLVLIDPQRDALDPGVRKEDGVLFTPPWGGTNTRVAIPYQPAAEEYDIRMTVQRRGEDRYGLNLGFVMGGRQATLDMDGASPRKWCVARIDGKSMHNGNVTTVVGERLKLGDRVAVVLQVRRGGVKVLCDGETVIDWNGRPEQLSLWDKIELPDAKSLFLVSQAEFAIYELTFTPTSN